MTQSWPAVRTHTSEHHGYEIGHAASIGLVAILIGLPSIGLGLSWLVETQAVETDGGISIYSVAQMVAYSPLVSWLGLLLGVPAVYGAIRAGYGGWLVTMAIGSVVGTIVLLASVWIMMAFTGLRIALIGAVFGAVFAGVYWMAMRLTSPTLFRGPGAGFDAPLR
jgi:hypothetical protein